MRDPSELQLSRYGSTFPRLGFKNALAWVAEVDEDGPVRGMKRLPEGVSKVLVVFGAALTDRSGDAERLRLTPWLPRFLGSARSEAVEQARGAACADWLVRTFAPHRFRAAGIEVELLPEIVTLEGLSSIASTATAAAELAASKRAEAEKACHPLHFKGVAAGALEAVDAAGFAAAWGPASNWLYHQPDFGAAAEPLNRMAAAAKAGATIVAARAAAQWPKPVAKNAAAKREVIEEATARGRELLRPHVDAVSPSIFELLELLLALGSERPA